MSPIVSTIEIARPPEEVYSYATDPSRFAEWQRDVITVRIDGSPLTVGTRYSTIRRLGGTERTMIQEITEVVPHRSWAARGGRSDPAERAYHGGAARGRPQLPGDVYARL